MTKKNFNVYFNTEEGNFISEKMKNRPSSNKGKKLSEEHKRKISETLKRRYQ